MISYFLWITCWFSWVHRVILIMWFTLRNLYDVKMTYMLWISEWFALHCVYCQNGIDRATVCMYSTRVNVTWSILILCPICCMCRWLLWLSTQWCFLPYVIRCWLLHTHSTVSIQTLVCTLLSIKNYSSVINYIHNGNCDISCE